MTKEPRPAEEGGGYALGEEGRKEVKALIRSILSCSLWHRILIAAQCYSHEMTMTGGTRTAASVVGFLSLGLAHRQQHRSASRIKSGRRL